MEISTTLSKTPITTPMEDPHYDHLQRLISQTAGELAQPKTWIFTTSACGLFDVFLAALPEDMRQAHRCNCCRRFFHEFAGLVTIDERGSLVPLFWPELDTPATMAVGPYAAAIRALRAKVVRSAIVSVFADSRGCWGTPATGPWRHLHWHSTPIPKYRGEHSVQEEHRLLIHATEHYRGREVQEAIAMLRAGLLPRPEKMLPMAEWLLAAIDTRQTKGRRLWIVAADAPAGWCHVGNTALGSLLDMIKDEKSRETIIAAMRKLLDPEKYARPQAAPTEGHIRVAERKVAELGIERSLLRRFAQPRDVEHLVVWRHTSPSSSPAAPGVFGHLLKRSDGKIEDIDAPEAMSWRTFAEDVLPSADAIEAFLPVEGVFVAYTTAVHPDAPPILQWDRVAARNPVAYYTYSKPTRPAHWGLASQTWCSVPVILKPPHCGADGKMDFGMMVLDGAEESRRSIGLGIFPEDLRSELHEIRRTIEAFSNAGQLDGYGAPQVCGIAFGLGSQMRLKVRATCRGIRTTYQLDRMR